MKKVEEITPLLLTDGPEDLPAEHLELLMQEADRALMLVDSRMDEPGRRVASGIAPEDATAAGGVSELGLTVAELIDCYPGIQYDIESVSERMRMMGAKAAAVELARHPHLLDLARLSLETLFRVCPSVESYLYWLPEGDHEIDLRTPPETYAALRETLEMLRRSMS